MFRSRRQPCVLSVGHVEKWRSGLHPCNTFGLRFSLQLTSQFLFLMCCHSLLSPSFFSSTLLCFVIQKSSFRSVINVFSLSGESTIKRNIVNLGPFVLLCSVIQPLLFVQSAHLSVFLSRSSQKVNLDAASKPGCPLLSVADTSQQTKCSSHFT